MCLSPRTGSSASRRCRPSRETSPNRGTRRCAGPGGLPGGRRQHRAKARPCAPQRAVLTRPGRALHLAGLLGVHSLFTVACAPPGGPADEAGSTSAASEETGASEATDTPLQCEPFAPYGLDIDAQPNGPYQRGDLGAPFIADDDDNRVLTRTDAGTGARLAELPDPTLARPVSYSWHALNSSLAA